MICAIFFICWRFYRNFIKFSSVFKRKIFHRTGIVYMLRMHPLLQRVGLTLDRIAWGNALHPIRLYMSQSQPQRNGSKAPCKQTHPNDDCFDGVWGTTWFVFFVFLTVAYLDDVGKQQKCIDKKCTWFIVEGCKQMGCYDANYCTGTRDVVMKDGDCNNYNILCNSVS